jgi:predicted nicotinamide N-methyase
MNSVGDEMHWIESESLFASTVSATSNTSDDDHHDLHLDDLFADPDPFETFTLQWELLQSCRRTTQNYDHDNTDSINGTVRTLAKPTSSPVHITVTGVKAENGQTLHSTGLTLWRASHILADWLVSIHNRNVLRPPPPSQPSRSSLPSSTAATPFGPNNTFDDYNDSPLQQLHGATVLELGAGLGVPSMLCHYYLGAALTVVTDGDVRTLHNLRQNMALQQEKEPPHQHHVVSSIVCQQLVWGNPQHIRSIQETVRQHLVATAAAAEASSAASAAQSSVHTLPNNTSQNNIETTIDTTTTASLSRFDIILGSDIIYVEHVVEPLFDTVRQLLKVGRDSRFGCTSTSMLSSSHDDSNPDGDDDDGTLTNNSAIPNGSAHVGGIFVLAFARRNVSIDFVLRIATEKGFDCEIPSNPSNAHSNSMEGVYIFRHYNS